MHTKHMGKGMAFLEVGSVIGAGAALLFAPQSGAKTRRNLLHFGKLARNRSERILLDLGHRTTKLVESFSER